MTAVEVSDRADFTAGLTQDLAAGCLTVHKADFYQVHLDEQFDAVLLERIRGRLRCGSVPVSAHSGMRSLLREQYEYLAVVAAVS
ncbi:hypothetical protein [Nocardia alba]|uniref:hypothetical protein n=1 Tax=Nocardia alba TaxID=225051 RepID=UPI00104A5327|nr:hypothetical protein [Nocardia alba]